MQRLALNSQLWTILLLLRALRSQQHSPSGKLGPQAAYVPSRRWGPPPETSTTRLPLPGRGRPPLTTPDSLAKGLSLPGIGPSPTGVPPMLTEATPASASTVALTSTIEQVFGSGHMVPGHGFMLNNELTDFDAVPGGPNQPDAGKQPVSSMTPTIVFEDGKPRMTIGAAGGLTIITSVFQTFQNLSVFGMDVATAVEAPRTFGALYPDIFWETGVPQAARTGLEQLGHSVASGPSVLSNLQAIVIDEQGHHGAADSSAEDGTAIGLSVVSN